MFRLSKWTYYRDYLLGKYQQFPYETIKGNANKALPPTQYKAPVYQLSAIIYTRRPHGARGGMWCPRPHTHEAEGHQEEHPAPTHSSGDAAQWKHVSSVLMHKDL